MGEAFDLIMNASGLTCFKHFLIGRGYPSISYIVHNRVVKQNWILRNDSNSIAKTS